MNNTFGDWLETWLELYVQPTTLAENTKLCYYRAVHACPAWLLEIPMERLSPLDIRRWLVEVSKVHPRAGQLDRVMFSRSLLVARKLGLTACVIDGDTCPAIDHQPKKTVVLNAQQLRQYALAVRNLPAAAPLLLCCCGLRRGESAGARRCDLCGNVLSICVQRGDNLTQLPLKSASSTRRIALPALVVDVLNATPDDGTGFFYSGAFYLIYKCHRDTLAAEGLPPVTLHGLRHSFATVAALAGVPIKLLQGYLGHANYKITADLYANHLPEVSTVCEQLFL